LFFLRQDERELPNLSQDNTALQQDAGSRNQRNEVLHR